MPEENRSEISLKFLVIKSREWMRYLFSKWIIIFIVAIIFGILGAFYAYFSKPKYTANLTFVLSSNSNNNSLQGLAGQLGLSFGVNSNDAFTGENIVELLTSQRIIKSALFRLLPDSSQSLINLFIRETEVQERWEKKERYKNLLPFPNDIKKLTPVQDSLVNEIFDVLLEKNLSVDKTDNSSSFYKVSATTVNEVLSCYLTKYVVKEASEFYISTKTKTSKQNLTMLQNEADSLRTLLGGSIVSSGAETDRTFNLNAAYQVQRSSAQKSQVNVTVLGTAYGEVVKNLELAKITLAKETPLFQIVDEPNIPLKKIKKGRLKFLIIGGFLGAFISITILLTRRLYFVMME